MYRVGRPNALTPFQQQEARERRAKGESVTSIARSFNVSHSTISRLDKWSGSPAMAA